MIRKLPSGKYRLYSRKKNPRTGRRRNLGTFASRAAAEKHERAVQYLKALSAPIQGTAAWHPRTCRSPRCRGHQSRLNPFTIPPGSVSMLLH